MRKWFALAGILVLAFAAWGTSQVGRAETPAPAAQPRTIDVVGKGTITATPDTAVITLGISTIAEGPSAAYKDAATIMANIATTLTEAGLKQDELKTSELSLGAEYNWTQEKGQVLRGYRATANVTITTQQLDKVPLFIEAGVLAGANQMNSLSFTVKDPDTLLDEAMDAAADDATAKAGRVAKRMGANVSKVLKITVMDDSGSYPRPVPMAYEAKADSAAMPVFTGSSKFTVSISATFEIE